MAAFDNQAWAAAYNAEYIGFKERGVFKVVKPEPEVKILDTLTRLDYKEDNASVRHVYAQEGTSMSMG
jgi:hypothetical protein